MKHSLRFLILLCASLAPAVADCLYECQGSLCSDYSNHSTMCLEIRARCQNTCSNKRSYGAIAYSAKDKGTGWSYGWEDQSRAEKEALKNCSDRGRACESIVWYYNGCGAVAADGKIVTWGRDSNKRRAEQTAMSECTKAGGKKCAIEVSQCSLK